MPLLRHHGEDRLVAELTAGLPLDPGQVILGPGDDCAIVRDGPGAETWLLLKTDCVIEGIHFLPDTPPALVGRKALNRAASDIAAMGGWPVHALVTMALPGDLPVAYAHGLRDGLNHAAREINLSIVGGETSRSPSGVFLTVAMIGRVEPSHCVLRSGGRPGDQLHVTGHLGGSLPSQRHLTFTPRLREARWLANNLPPSAMMDLSDGLASDLPRLARQSQTGFHLHLDKLPLNPGCDTDNALRDGEDYELLLAIAPEHMPDLQPRWTAAFPQTKLTHIGHLTTLDDPDQTKLDTHAGHDHFPPAP